MHTTKSWLLLALLIAVGVSLHVLMNYNAGVAVILDCLAFREYIHALIWATSYGVFALSFLFLVLLLDRWALAVLLGLASVSFLTNRIYNTLVAHRLEPGSMWWLLDQRGNLGNALGEFTWTFLAWAAAVACIIGIFIIWRRQFLKVSPELSTLRRRRAWRLGALAIFGLIHLSSYAVRPSMLPVETNIPIYSIASYFDVEPEPLPVTVEPSAPAGIEKIVLIVDESVRPDFFHRLVTDSLRDLPSLNFGEAASTVNVSAASNALLRWGLDDSRINSKDYDPRRSTYIWSFAKRAGYRTVLMDGQSGGRPQNFLGQKEACLIDEQLQLKSDLETDMTIARALRQHLTAPGREFIYIVKRGIHFPYEQSCPPDRLPEHPTRIQKYEAALLFNTGRFFSKLATGGIDFKRVFALYTSDHGQVLEEGKLTHGSPQPSWEEYFVPLVVLTASPEISKELRTGINGVRDHASHEQIFSTLLYVMGYPASNPSFHYAPPLLKRPDRYNVLLFPFIPTLRRFAGKVEFSTFDHFPYRAKSPTP